MKNSSDSFNYTAKEMIVYFLVVMLIGLIIETDITNKVSQAIYAGNLSTDLLKPISYHMLNFTQCMATKIIFLVLLICSAISLLFFSNYSSLFSLSLFVSFIINFELSYVIGLLAFWSNTVWGLTMVNSVLMDVFGGRLFPIELASNTMKKVCAFLPYQYIYYVPTQILEYKIESSWIFIQIIYAFALFFISRIIFKMGLKHYEAVGV